MIATKKLKKIKEEMISKVDKEKFKTALFWSTKCKDAEVCNAAIDKYLEEWADAKYEFYIGMGNELKVSKIIDIPISDGELRGLVDSLKKAYPFHSVILDYFSLDDFRKNACPKNETMEKYCSPTYKVGMKLSKFLSKYFMDDKFDIEVSKVLQNKACKGTVTISIDPLDYCFMSINKNKWNSCYNLIGSGYNTYFLAPLSVMRDEHMLVCYRGNTAEYDYDFNGKTIRYISINNRAMIAIDKKTENIVSFRAQPCGNGGAMSEWVKMTQEIVDKFNNRDKPSDWKETDEPRIEDAKWQHFYSDGQRMYYYDKGVKLDKIKFGVTNMICPVCGKNHTEECKNLCRDCRVKLGVR